MTLSPAIPLPPVTRVAVIGGAGPSGLVVVRQLLDAGVRPDQLAAFDGRSRAGGVWNYDESPGDAHYDWRTDSIPAVRTSGEIAKEGSNGPSAIYDRLRTNLPKTVMAYRNFPFPKDVSLFPWHYQVKDYLQDYAEKQGINEHITWNTRVLKVYHTPGGSAADRWTIEVEHTGADGSTSRRTESASHIVVANGHYNEPYVPPIPGLDTFPGLIVHSRWWRNPLMHRGKNVVVVGSKSSGSDIARELAEDDMACRAARSEQPRKLYQSVRGTPAPGERVYAPDLEWANELELVAEIERAAGATLVLKDGRRLEGVDVVVFATGYLYSYPFFPADAAPFDTHPVTRSLAPADGAIPRAGGNSITNLNPSDTFYEPDPTLAFVGLHYLVNPFPLGEITARLIARSFAAQRIPALPPLRRKTDDPHCIHIGYPMEYENQDNFLRAIGEGGDEDGPNGEWARPSDELRLQRRDALDLRKQHLGY